MSRAACLLLLSLLWSGVSQAGISTGNALPTKLTSPQHTTLIRAAPPAGLIKPVGTPGR